MFYLQKENKGWYLEKILDEKNKNFDFKVTTVIKGFRKEKDG